MDLISMTELEKVQMHNRLALRRLEYLRLFDLLSDFDKQFYDGCLAQTFRMTNKQMELLEKICTRNAAMIENDITMMPYLWMLFAKEGNDLLTVTERERQALATCLANRSPQSGRSFPLSHKFIKWMDDVKLRITKVFTKQAEEVTNEVE